MICFRFHRLPGGAEIYISSNGSTGIRNRRNRFPASVGKTKIQSKKEKQTKMMMKKNRKGFTMAELLIVVAIIAVLVAIAIP